MALNVQSSELLKEALASNAEEIPVWLITLTHQSFEPYRFASTGNQLHGFDEISGDPVYRFTSRSKDFIVCPFALILPDASMGGNAIPVAKLQIMNASPEISKTMQEVQTQIAINLEMVHFSKPDTVLSSVPAFYLESVDVVPATITGSLKIRQFFDNIICPVNLVPSVFPGAFL